jgi:type IV secretory pathway TrbL component
MNVRKVGGIFLASAIFLGSSASFLLAQNDSGAKQSMKDAGTETKDAAKDTGHAVKQGTKKAYHKTKRGVKKVHRKMDPDTPKPDTPKS